MSFTFLPTGDRICFEIEGKNYLFDGSTGMLEYDVPCGKQIGEEGTQNTPDIRRLDPDSPPVKIAPANFQPAIFSVFVSSTCNLNCSYCFNQGGTMGMKDRVMDRRTARDVMRFLKNHIIRAKNRHTIIRLFGGEPMLNRVVLLDIFEAVRGWKDEKIPPFRIALATNGTIHDQEVLECVKELRDNISVEISLDGGPEHHNAHRRLKNGVGSWQLAYDFTQTLRQEGVTFAIGAVIPYPYDYKEIAEELTAFGFDGFDIKDLVPHCMGGTIKTDVFRCDETLWRSKYIEYNKYCLDRVRYQNKELTSDRRVMLSAYKSSYRHLSKFACRAGRLRATIDTNGYIYPCDAFMRSDFILGDARNGWNSEGLAVFADLLDRKGSIITSRRECQSCFAKHLCRGGCYGLNWEKSGEIDGIRTERCEHIREKTQIDLFFLSVLKRLKSEPHSEPSPAESGITD